MNAPALAVAPRPTTVHSQGALRARPAAAPRPGTPAPTGFVLYVDLDPENFAAMPAEVQRAAETLRELAHEWLPNARTRTVLSTRNGPGPVTAARPPTGSLRATLAAIPDTPDIVIDMSRRVVTVDQRVVKLPPKEFDLLAHLAQAQGRVVTRDELRRTVWFDRDVSEASRTVDVHIRRLRAIPALAALITTVHGMGYRVPLRPHLHLER